jgi:putative hydrolase of HD superfamily
MPEYRLSPELVKAIGRLKDVPRTGWLDRGIAPEETESVADHSFGVATLAWLLAPEELDRARVVELALLHDLAESAVGDATPYDRETLQTLDPDTRRNWLNQRHFRTDEQRAAKQASETDAIASLAATLPEDRREQMLSRWYELSERLTPEAKFVKEMDILETWLQSRRYAERHPEAPMDSFELEARSVFGDAFVAGMGE